MKKLLLSSSFAALAAPALAHTDHGAVTGVVHSVSHATLGSNHIVVGLGIGVVAIAAAIARALLSPTDRGEAQSASAEG